MISAFPNSKAEMEKAQAFFREALETAVRKMTAAPAARLDLSNRGTIAPGKRADLLIFDNNAFRDEATYLEPMKTAS
ncbi:MAG: amidohydrolase family protein, partial [Treponema sp.]|nr:amidohydrolase family protein [Treponema sp.]